MLKKGVVSKMSKSKDAENEQKAVKAILLAYKLAMESLSREVTELRCRIEILESKPVKSIAKVWP